MEALGGEGEVPALLGWGEAKGGQGPEGQVNVSGGLHSPGDGQAALRPQQGQGQQQAGDELGGYIPRQGKLPRL